MRVLSSPLVRRLSLAACLVLPAAIGLYVLTGCGSYFYASYLESRWSKADPKTKIELEKYLHLYSERIFDPKTSLWGHDRKMAGDERMVQYLILWSQPLDVVYDDHDRVRMIYTSYE